MMRLNLKKLSLTSIFLGLAVGLTACGGEMYQNESEEIADFRQDYLEMQERVAGNKRLSDTLFNTGAGCLVANERYINGISCYLGENKLRYNYTQKENSQRFQFLVDNNMNLELSRDMMVGAVVQIHKDRIVLNELVPESVQVLALNLAVDYMDGQKEDGLEYGIGESFTIGAGNLVSVGKNRRAHKSILLPSPTEP